MAKICRVIQIKLNQLVQGNVHIITTYQRSVFKLYHSDQHLSGVFTYKMAAKTDWH